MRDPWRLLRRSAPELPWRTRSRQTYSCQRPPRAGEALARALGGGNTRSMVDHGLAPARQRAARLTAVAHCLEHEVDVPKPATTLEVEEPTKRPKPHGSKPHQSPATTPKLMYQTPAVTNCKSSKLKDQRLQTPVKLRNQSNARCAQSA